MTKKQRRELTASEVAAAARLKAEFEATKPTHGLTYERMAIQLGWTASAPSHYMNGHVPINMEALIRMCALIPGANPRRVFPELFEGIPFSFDDDPEGLLDSFYAISPELQQSILTIISKK